MKTYGYRYLFGILSAFIIFVSLGIVSHISMDKDVNAGEEAKHSYEVINVLKEIEIGLKDLMLARRGYIISGDGIFLESFELKKLSIIDKLNKLNRLTAANKTQNINSAQLRNRIFILVNGIEYSVSLFSYNKEYNKQQQIITSLTVVFINYFDHTFREMESNQRLILEQKLNDENRAESLLWKFILTGNLIAVFLIVLSVVLIRKQNQKTRIEKNAKNSRELELKTKQKEIETLMNTVPVGVYYVDNSANCTYINESWSEITGYKPEEVYGTDLLNIIHPYDREITTNLFISAVVSGKNFKGEYRYICKNGDIKFVTGEASARYDAEGNITGFVGSIMDISEQHAYKDKLIKFNRLFEGIAQGIPDPIFVKDNNGYYEYINSSAAKIVGRKIEDIIGKNDYDLFPETIANETIAKDKLVYQSKGNYNYEISSVMKDGTMKTFLTTKGIIKNSKNKPVGLFGILRDITAIRESELQIKRTLKEKEILLREVHHRVKNNLQIVASLLRLQSGYVKDPESMHYFQDSQNRINTIAMLHEKLYGSENYSNVELKKFVEQLLDILVKSFALNSEQIKITTEIAEQEIDVEYSLPIGLVLNEIITNSFKYAFPEGRKGEIFIRIKKTDAELEIIVGDNGIGLSAEIDIKNSKSMGQPLIYTLIEGQLKGSVGLTSTSSGVIYELKIPIKEAVLLENS